MANNRKLLTLLLAVLLSLTCLFALTACNGGEGEGNNGSTGTTYTVTVVDGSGNPIKDAYVQLRLGEEMPDVVATGEDGSAVFTDLKKGEWQVKVLAPDGYLSTDFVTIPEDGAITVTLEKEQGGNEGGNEGGNGGNGGNGGGVPSVPTEKYTVTVKSKGGLTLSGVNFYVYLGEDDLVGYGTTGNDGKAEISLEEKDGYRIVLTSIPDGYAKEDSYTFTDNEALIELTSSVIKENRPQGTYYKVGDVIHDFSITLPSTDPTVPGGVFSLSEMLEQSGKELVMINFWYSTCGPCVTEFPYLQDAIDTYSDMAIIALNPYPADDATTVKNFKASMGLTIDLVKDNIGLSSCFNLTGFPTTIFVDRYGVICMIHEGSITDAKFFSLLDNQFCGDIYNQTLFNSFEELSPIEIPNVSMPSSEEMNNAFSGGSLNAEYLEETETSDAEYSWPFLISEDGSYIYPANSKKDNSFATLHIEVEMNKDEALAFDYFASTEYGADILFVLIDGVPIYNIMGISTGYQTCYPYVATEDGTYRVTLCYAKDSSTDAGEDTVHLKNLRPVSIDSIDVPSYIPRYAATNPRADGDGYETYVDVFFNEEDGYYHVGSKTGPLLLADLMAATNMSDISINDLGYAGSLIYDGVNLYIELEQYCNYAINGELYGVCPVDESLYTLLTKVARIACMDMDARAWLQACKYYNAYGTDGIELGDPIKGLSPHSAFTAYESTAEEKVYNTVTYDGRVIMPRGLWYSFIPERSGVYNIVSQSDEEVSAWIFLEDKSLLMTYEDCIRFTTDLNNCNMTVYLEEGTEYFIDIAYYDIYAKGSFTFTIDYIAPSLEFFRTASPGYFTYVESAAGGLNEILALGIEVALGEDDYYHELRADGTLGSIVYADFLYTTDIFSHALLEMIELGAFNFSMSESDHQVYTYYKLNDFDKAKTISYLRNLWGDTFAESMELYLVEDVLNGVYHGTGEDLTEDILVYVEQMLGEDAGELEGCIPVDAGLAALLQMLMDKYTFPNVEHSWTKVCYYYEYLGPAVAEN